MDLKLLHVTTTITTGMRPRQKSLCFPNGVRFGVQVNLCILVVATDYHDGVTFGLIHARGKNLTSLAAGNGGRNFEHLTLPLDDAGTPQREIVEHAKDSFVHPKPQNVSNRRLLRKVITRPLFKPHQYRSRRDNRGIWIDWWKCSMMRFAPSAGEYRYWNRFSLKLSMILREALSSALTSLTSPVRRTPVPDSILSAGGQVEVQYYLHISR